MKRIFNDEQFKNPPKEERAITFWAFTKRMEVWARLFGVWILVLIVTADTTI